MAGRVIVVGSVNVDLVVRGERLPAPGETVIGGVFGRFHGGKGANQAVAAARMGVPVAFVGAVGDDDLGTAALTALEGEAIDVAGVSTIAGESTGVALIIVGAAGENLIAVASGANGRVSAHGVGRAVTRLQPQPGDVVLVGHEIPTDAAAEALRVGRSMGATTILNPAPAAGIDGGIAATADLLTPNEPELAALQDAGVDIRSVRLATIVSQGPAGARILSPDGRSRQAPALPVTSVDTTGAGDTLNGVLAAGLAEGRSLDEAIRRAVTAASLSVMKPGAREAMPSAAELEWALAATWDRLVPPG